MHSIIFQVSTRPIAQDQYVDEDRINEGELVIIDYTETLTETDRRKAINRLAEKILPSGMFTLNPDNESLTYKGGYAEWSKEYAEEIKERANAIDPTNAMKATGPVWQLQKYIINPLATDCVFINAFYEGEGTAERSRTLMKMFSDMQIGQKLYIGRVYDYHF